MIERRYVLHGGHVLSQLDGDRHYISAKRLQELYRLQQDEILAYVDEDGHSFRGMGWPEYAVHLFPKYNGEYDV